MYLNLYIQERLKTIEFLNPTISQLHYYSNWMNVIMQGSSNFENLFKGTSHLWIKITFNLLFRKQGAQDTKFRQIFETLKNLFPEMQIRRCMLNFN